MISSKNFIHTNIKKFFLYSFIGTLLIGQTIATNHNVHDNEVLFIGCRPWDSNVQEVSNLNETDFVDFLSTGIPQPAPLNFFQRDVNDQGTHSAGHFSEFAEHHRGQYTIIVIDWMTAGHIRREGAWADFAKLLALKGKMFVPVTKVTFSGPISRETAQSLIENNKLDTLFFSANILDYNQLPDEKGLDLLRLPRLGITEAALTMTPAIIVATHE